jgi:hypothetical protein
VAQSSTEPVFPVGFDDDALAVDLAHLPASAEVALRSFRKAIRRQGGIPRAQLMACQAEARDGTRLGGCVKTYVPWPDGRFGAVFVAVTHPNRPMALRVFAFGIRHHPHGSNAKTVYEVADRRFNAST